MKFWLLLFVLFVALANLVVAEDEYEKFQTEKRWQDIEGLETNTSHTRRLFGESSKQLQLVPVLQSSSLIVKTEENVTGIAAIALKYGGFMKATFVKIFPGTSEAIKTKFGSITVAPAAAATAKFNAWKTAHPKLGAGVVLSATIAFKATDAIITTLLVVMTPAGVVLGPIIIADAVFELAKAVYGVGGGGSVTDQQTARVAYQGLSLILAIGGLDGMAGTGDALAEAMGELYYNGAGNLGGEATDTMGAALTPAEKTASGCTTCTTRGDLTAKRNAALQAKFDGKTYDTAGGKKRKLVYGGNPTGNQWEQAAKDAYK